MVKLLWSFGFYSLAASVPALSNFFLVPLLLRRLGIVEFSNFALVEPLILTVSALLLAGAQFAVLRGIARGEKTPAEGLGVLLSIVAICFLIVDVPTGIVLSRKIGWHLASVVCLTIVTEALASALTYIFRAQGRITLVVINDGGRAFALLVLALLCEWTNADAMNTVGYVVLARGLITLAIFVVLAVSVVNCKLPSVKAIVEVVRYGLPMLGSQFLFLVSMNIDRYIIGWSGLSASDLTNYVVHGKAAGILAILFLAPVYLWFPTQAMKAKEGPPRSEMEAITAAYAAGFLVVAMAIVLGIPLFWDIVFPGTGFDAVLMMTSMLAIGVQGLSILWNTGALQPGKTQWNILPPAVFLVLMLPFGAVAAPIFGNVGVAFAKLLALVGYAGTFYILSSKILSRPGSLLPQLWLGCGAVMCVFFSMIDGRHFLERGAAGALALIFILLGIFVNRRAIGETLSRTLEQRRNVSSV